MVKFFRIIRVVPNKTNREEYMRSDGRDNHDIRAVKMTPDYVSYPEGSVLIEMGNTIVLCNATIQEGVPKWLESREKTQGWITGEYSLLPRSTHSRTSRETQGLRGRTQEIRRLIGRSLRPAFDLEKLGPYTCIMDCDVLQADGGTRSAAITGGYVALAIAIKKMIRSGLVPDGILRFQVAAISAGVVDGISMVDLCYAEDSNAESDMNVVMTSDLEFIEVQITGETAPFSNSDLDNLLTLSRNGISELLNYQKQVLDSK